jgi:hypothetical protein
VGKGALLSSPAWAKSRVRHSPSKTGVNALVAHAAKVRETILPTLRLFHSITSSARPRSGSGTVSPSALAVLRLRINST